MNKYMVPETVFTFVVEMSGSTNNKLIYSLKNRETYWVLHQKQQQQNQLDSLSQLKRPIIQIFVNSIASATSRKWQLHLSSTHTINSCEAVSVGEVKHYYIAVSYQD